MTPAPFSPRLQFVKRLVSLGSSEEILEVISRETLHLAGADRAFATCNHPAQAWDQGLHVDCDGKGVRRASAAARSALYAIHRGLCQRPPAGEVRRIADNVAIFHGLGCADDVDVVYAVPIVHRSGRVWGSLVFFGGDSAGHTTGVSELAQLATVGLENAQRLAFARGDQDRLLLLAEATSDAFYDWHFDNRDFWWGGGVIKLLNADADPVQNTPQWKLDRIHPDDSERVRSSLDEARFTKAMTWTCEYRFRRQDGSFIHVEDRGYFLREPSGRAYRMIGSIRDITAMKDLLAREQRARSDAESANRAKDEFLAMLGHELRNPLAPIVTGLQLVRLRGNPEIERELTILERQAQHLIRLVDDLLDISRIAHGKIELKRAVLEIAPVIAAAIETASPLIEGRGHTLTVDVTTTGLPVFADRARLAQAIANLLTNAAKYTEPGGHIAVRARREHDTVVVSVRDNGIGIDPAMLSNIFNMFVQERQTLDRSQGGLGLGLSIVRSLIDLHGGTIETKSEGRGRGSEFTVRLPVAVQPVALADPKADIPAPLPSGARKKIMVVDDNEDAAELLAVLLRRMGNKTRITHDAHSALELVEEFQPDVAVLDIGLPVMDGYELARRLRALPCAKSIRLVALTGYGQPSDRERAMAAGFDAHLVKPIGMDALDVVIGPS